MNGTDAARGFVVGVHLARTQPLQAARLNSTMGRCFLPSKYATRSWTLVPRFPRSFVCGRAHGLRSGQRRLGSYRRCALAGMTRSCTSCGVLPPRSLARPVLVIPEAVEPNLFSDRLASEGNNKVSCALGLHGTDESLDDCDASVKPTTPREK